MFQQGGTYSFRHFPSGSSVRHYPYFRARIEDGRLKMEASSLSNSILSIALGLQWWKIFVTHYVALKTQIKRSVANAVDHCPFTSWDMGLDRHSHWHLDVSGI